MRYLCIDTSNGASLSIVDHDDDKHVVLAETVMDNPRMHGESIGFLLEELLNQLGVSSIGAVGVDRVVCGVGPAPFTGLRAGLITARVSAKVTGAEIIGVSSLDVLALQGFDVFDNAKQIFVATDAKRKEVYYALYERDGFDDVVALVEPSVEKAEIVDEKHGISRGEGIVKIGDGCKKYSNIFTLADNAPLNVDSSYLARIAYFREKAGKTISNIEPLYLRRPDVQEPVVKK